jgi:hypothetical protein
MRRHACCGPAWAVAVAAVVIQPHCSWRGDNIYTSGAARKLVEVPNPSHGERSAKRDLRGWKTEVELVTRHGLEP